MTFGLAVLTFFSSQSPVCGQVKVSDLLPVAFGTCCSPTASLCFDPFTSPKMLMYMLSVTFVLVYLPAYAICMCTA